jgi:hypothetical protein
MKEYDVWVAEHASKPQTIAEEEHRNECLENMYYSTVRESINDFYGDVIMCYDHATASFAYYARTGNIPYKYLETISRKYMIETNAPRDIHVDIRSEYQKAKERNNPATALPVEPAKPAEPAEPAEPGEEENSSDVFAKLKSYNTAYNLYTKTSAHHVHPQNHRHQEHQQPPSSFTHTQPSSVILRENSNRYSYRGKLTDFEEHHKTFLAERRKKHSIAPTTTATTTTTTTATTTSYAEFKKRNSGQ